MTHLVQLDQNQIDAVDVRIEMDLRIGAAFTRLQSLYLQAVFPNVLGGYKLTYGPCQFPTLGFVVKRFLEIEHFVPQEFYRIDVKIKRDDISVDFNWQRHRLFDKMTCLVLFEECVEKCEATVTSVQGKPREKWKPLPLTTVEMQKLASTKLHLNSENVMKIAEDLYMRGFISYPRTETDSFPNEFDFNTPMQQQQQEPAWGAYATGLLNGGFRPPRKGKNNDQAHSPIYPTSSATGQNLNHNEQRVYELVTRHFLACISDNARGHETAVDIRIVREIFTATGLIVTERNYLEVYTYERWGTHELPNFVVGEVLVPTDLNMNESHTTAPNFLTEADLIDLMDKHGIGTDATIHEHIKKVLEREYVVKDGNFFLPTNLGISLVEGYDAMEFAQSFSEPVLRAKMEADMKLISERRKTKQQALDDAIQMYRDAFVKATDEKAKLRQAVEKFFGVQGEGNGNAEGGGGLGGDPPPDTVRRCTKCNDGYLPLRQTKAGSFVLGCNTFPICDQSFWLPKSITECSVVDEVCAHCQPETRKIMFKTARGAHLPPMIDCFFCSQDIKYMQETDHFDPKPPGGAAAAGPPKAPLGEQPRPQAPKAPAPKAPPAFPPASSHQKPQPPPPPPPAKPLATSFTARAPASSSSSSFFKPEAAKPASRPYAATSSAFTSTPATSVFPQKQPYLPRTQSFSSQGSQGATFESQYQRSAPRYSHADPPAPGVSLECPCGLQVARRVSSTGQNNGRAFFCCPTRGEAQCNFFLWEDQMVWPPTSLLFFHCASRPSTNSLTFWQQSSSSSSLVCNCGVSAVSFSLFPSHGREALHLFVFHLNRSSRWS